MYAPDPLHLSGGYGEMVARGLGRGRKEEEDGGVGALLYSQEHAYLPKTKNMCTFLKWTLALSLQTTCPGLISWILSAAERSTVTTVKIFCQYAKMIMIFMKVQLSNIKGVLL